MFMATVMKLGFWMVPRNGISPRMAMMLRSKCSTSKIAFRRMSTSVYSYGMGINGALGHGNTDALDNAKEIEAMRGLNVKEIAAGWGHSAVVTEDGRLIVFGRTHDMQNTLKLGRLWEHQPLMARLALLLGTRYSIDEPSPRELPVVDKETGWKEKVANVVCSAGLTGALTERGDLYMLGNNRYGQCGIGTREMFVWEMTRLVGVPSGVRVTNFDLGFQHGVLTTSDGKVYTWGKGERGQLGLGPEKMDMHETPSLVDPESFEGERIVKVSSGFNSCVALSENGVVYTWGKFQGLELDEKGGNFVDAARPRRVELDGKVEQIVSGLNHHVAVCQSSGKVWMWGIVPDTIPLESLKQYDDRSLYDSGAARTMHEPVEVPLESALIVRGYNIRAGFHETFLEKDGVIYLWDWTMSPTHFRFHVDGLAVKAVCTGWRHTLCLVEKVLD